jgi:hypothetical protein
MIAQKPVFLLSRSQHSQCSFLMSSIPTDYLKTVVSHMFKQLDDKSYIHQVIEGVAVRRWRANSY